MRFYNALVRLNGSVTNEVWRLNISAAEVLLMNEIHNGGAIAEIKQISDIEYTAADHRRLRARLEQRYNADSKERHRNIMNSLFGAQKSALLPEQVDMADLTDIPDEEPEIDVEDEDAAPSTKYEDAALDEDAVPPPKDAKAAIKESLRKLDWPVPSGNVSEERLREELAAAQKAAGYAPEEPAAAGVV